MTSKNKDNRSPVKSNKSDAISDEEYNPVQNPHDIKQ